MLHALTLILVDYSGAESGVALTRKLNLPSDPGPDLLPLKLVELPFIEPFLIPFIELLHCFVVVVSLGLRALKTLLSSDFEDLQVQCSCFFVGLGHVDLCFLPVFNVHFSSHVVSFELVQFEFNFLPRQLVARQEKLGRLRSKSIKAARN